MPMWSLMRRAARNWTVDADESPPTARMETDLIYACEVDGCGLWMSPETLTPEREGEIEEQARRGFFQRKAAKC